MAAQSVLTERGPETARNLTTPHTCISSVLEIPDSFRCSQTSPRANRSAFHYLTDRPPQCARRSKDSSDSDYAMGSTSHNPQFDARQGHGVFLFSRTSRSVLELTQPPIQRILGFYPEDKAAGTWGWPPPSNAAVNEWSCTSASPIRFHGVDSGQLSSCSQRLWRRNRVFRNVGA